MSTQWGRYSTADVCLQPALPGSARTRRLRRARPQALNVIRCSPAWVAGTGQPSKRAREAEGGSAQEARGSKRWRELPAGLAGTQVGMQATSLQAVSACGSMQVTLLGRHAPVGMHQSTCTSRHAPVGSSLNVSCPGNERRHAWPCGAALCQTPAPARQRYTVCTSCGQTLLGSRQEQSTLRPLISLLSLFHRPGPRGGTASSPSSQPRHDWQLTAQQQGVAPPHRWQRQHSAAPARHIKQPAEDAGWVEGPWRGCLLGAACLPATRGWVHRAALRCAVSPHICARVQRPRPFRLRLEGASASAQQKWTE